jgi:hypothetical protein
VTQRVFELFLVHKISTCIYIYENGKRKREKKKRKKRNSHKRARGILAQPSASARAARAAGPARPANGARHGRRGDGAMSTGPRTSEGRRGTMLGEKQWFTGEKGPAAGGFDGGSPPVAWFSVIG